ncbi:uncharacterized protein LOC135081298 [Ostrinia nubilalis]|uniref:uncharacterized protein LOC135081298 n=1 Tax=Ostrinia nubilalis TaxID=29057 RepID=UPI003082519A
MNSVHWSAQEDEILIDFVKVNEALYNTKCADYRKPHVKQNLWCEIAEKFPNKTDVDCSKRWCYVRDYYIRRKSRPGTCGETAKRRFELLHFLDKFHPRYSSMNGSDGTIVDGSESIDNMDNSEGTPSQNEETYDAPEYQDNQDSNYGDDGNNDYIPNHRKRKIVDGMQQIRITNSNEPDENDLFFSSMAKIVKKLSRYEQAQLRMQIGTLVGNAELRCIENESTMPQISNVIQKTEF